MKNLILTLLLGIVLAACQQDEAGGWKATDLLPYGIPITILAPDSIDVNSSELGGLLTDVTIKSGEDYFIQIYATDAETNDISQVKAAQLADVRNSRYFSKIIKEDEDGFIYEIRIDDNNVHYSFRHIRIQGDKEYIFQPGLTGLFTQEQTERMYAAVQRQK